MNVEVFVNQQYTDKDGNLTKPMEIYNTLINQALQANLSNDGFIIPSRTTADINYIFNSSNPNRMPNGTILYDSQVHKYKGLENGVIVVFATTPV